MIYFFTGLPGAGKTLNAIKFVSEDSLFKNRPVFYYGITGLNISEWIELTEDDVKRWDKLPDGAVIIIDEVQRLWRVRSASRDIPLEVQALETHRHRGVDFILTCQNPMQVDVGVRRLVGKHYHLDRSFGMKTARRITYERCIDDPYDSKHLSSSIDRIDLDKNYFGKYHSAEVHTHKTRLPKKAYFYGTFLILFIAFVYYAFNGGISLFRDKQTQSDNIENNKQLITPEMKQEFENIVYTSMHKERLAGIPWTTPFYDGSIKIKAIPKVSGCMRLVTSEYDYCVCNTQQGTIIDMPKNLCIHYAARGSFDFEKEDAEDEHQSNNETKTANIEGQTKNQL